MIKLTSFWCKLLKCSNTTQYHYIMIGHSPPGAFGNNSNDLGPSLQKRYFFAAILLRKSRSQTIIKSARDWEREGKLGKWPKKLALLQRRPSSSLFLPNAKMCWQRGHTLTQLISWILSITLSLDTALLTAILCHVTAMWWHITIISKDWWSLWYIIHIHSIHGSGEKKQNVRKWLM